MLQYKEFLNSIGNLSALEYKKLVVEKWETDDYTNWKKFVNDNDSRLNLLHDSTPNNASFTALSLLKSSSSDNLRMMEYLVLQKSIFKNYVTMYVNTRIEVVEKGGAIMFPFTLVVSDLGYYKDVFQRAWKLVVTEFPDVIYIPYGFFKEELKTSFQTDKNAYELLFGYNGDVTTCPAVGNIYYRPDKKR